jgi:hypothetical protein
LVTEIWVAATVAADASVPSTVKVSPSETSVHFPLLYVVVESVVTLYAPSVKANRGHVPLTAWMTPLSAIGGGGDGGGGTGGGGEGGGAGGATTPASCAIR